MLPPLLDPDDERPWWLRPYPFSVLIVGRPFEDPLLEQNWPSCDMESAWAMAEDPCAEVGRYQGYIPAAAAQAVAADGFVSIISIHSIV